MNQFHMKMLVNLAIILFAVESLVLVAKADRQAAGRRINNSGAFKSPCGNADQVSKRVGTCLIPVFDLVEGKYPPPRTDEDLIGHCNRFNGTEKCVRIIGKDCLTGIHKTAVSAIASATKRFRAQECRTEASRARYTDPLTCAIKRASEMTALYKTMTGMAQGIRDLNITPEEKVIKTCCLLNQLDKEIETRFNRECPKSTSIILGISHAMTDDARTTLCRNPKCQNALDAVARTQYKPPQNFIEPIMQILFMLGTD